jgi:hypothetical protein
MASLTGDLARLDGRCFSNRRLDWRAQLSTAITAELGGRRILRATLRTASGNSGSALRAELLAGWIVRATVRAAHRLTLKPREYAFLYNASWKETSADIK